MSHSSDKVNKSEEASHGPVRFEIVSAEQAESALGDISSDTALIICDADGTRAASVASDVSNRTAVFVGNLASGEDRLAVDEMASELSR